MLPLFAFPWAFLALLTLPALAAIYWFRSKYRRHTVSSLMLWVTQREAREGGSKIERFQTPLVFFIELAVLLLAVLAAVGPKLHAGKGTRPLVVVLDDSFSMQAGGADSPRTRAMAGIEKELDQGWSYSIRFILANKDPQLLGEPVRTPREAVAVLANWKCLSLSADLDRATAFASELAGDRALIMVVTDHKPPREPEEGRVVWRSFGRPQPNWAFVNATRSSKEDHDRCLLEVANLSADPQSTTLTVANADTGEERQRAPLQLSPQETRRIIFEVPKGSPALRAKLGDDALAIDNSVVLMPEPLRQVRVELRLGNEPLHALVKKAVAAVPGVTITATRPEFIITDQEQARTTNPEIWILQVLMEKESEAYVGPFVLDRGHPATEGLSLQGVVWSAGKTDQVAGRPIIMAGNIPLLTDAESLTGRHDLRLRLRTDLSTLQESPDWPILFWNLVQWRGAQAPGLNRTNLRLGSETFLTVPAEISSVRIRTPDGKTREAPVLGKSVAVRAADVGVYEIQAGPNKYAFASNALDRQESDLTNCTAGEWGNWLDAESVQMEFQNIAWLLLLAAVGFLAFHGFLTSRAAKGHR